MSACGCLPGLGTSTRVTRCPWLSTSFWTSAATSADVLLVEPVLRHEDLQLIEKRLLAQLRQRVERDVAVDQVLHAGLRLADIVDAAADTQGLLVPASRLHDHGVADLRASDLEGIPLDQDLACSRRPRALLGIDLADSDLPEVLDHEEHQVAPLHRAGLDAARDSSTGFRIADSMSREDRLRASPSSIESVRKRERRRVGGQIAPVQLSHQDRVGGQDSPKTP